MGDKFIEGFEFTVRDVVRMNYNLESRGIASFGITVGQSNLLFMIKERGYMQMSELAAGVGVTTGAATGFIARLLKRGLVNRAHDSQDRRRVLVKLTAKGEQVVEKIRRQKQQRLAGLMGIVSESERKSFRAILNKMQGYLRTEVERKLNRN
jgi:DNA-binding MarR family transcriptional regulator